MTKESTITKLLKDIKKSVLGLDEDFTTGSIKRAILLLAIPMVLEMVMESIFAIVDIYFVTKLGAGAVATVGITESIITIVYSLGVGLSVGTTALVARRIGEHQYNKAAIVAVQAIVVGFSISLIISIIGVFYSKELLLLMGVEEKIALKNIGYTQIMLIGNGIIILLFIINAVFRSAGNAAISMRVLCIANGLNIILDPCLICGIGPFPELGIEGAAWATNIGRGIAVLYQIYLLFYGNKKVQLSRENLIFKFKTAKKLIKVSLGSIGQYLIATASWIGLMRIISEYGENILAGYTIAIRLVIFALLPAWGISNAAATLVGQNLGANKAERAEKAVWLTGKINTIVMVSLGILLYIFAHDFIIQFSKDINIITPGVNCLKIVSIGFLFYGFAMVLTNALNGAGDTYTPTLINVVSFWIVQIPLALLLSNVLNLKESGVFYAIVIAEAVMTFLAFYAFNKGKWKHKKI